MAGGSEMELRVWVMAIMVIGLWAAAAGAAVPSVPMQTIAPEQTDAFLVNPGMGLYQGGTLNPDDMPSGAWYRDPIAIGYFRDDWADLEPDAEGQYRFDEYFE